MAQSHYQNQCWLTIWSVRSCGIHLVAISWEFSWYQSWYEFQNYQFKITVPSPRSTESDACDFWWWSDDSMGRIIIRPYWHKLLHSPSLGPPGPDSGYEIRPSRDQSHKSHNAPVPYPTMHHSEQKCAHFCSEWYIVAYGTGALWDLWIWSIGWCQCDFMVQI